MNNAIHNKDYYLRASDFDTFRNLQPAAVLDLFQDAAGEHAQKLKVDYDQMILRNMMWVIVRVKYRILQKVKMYQRVNVVTWPHPNRRLDFQRDYLIRDENGSPVVKGTSQWALMDSRTRKLVLARDIYGEIDSFCEENTFAEKFLKVPDFEEADPGYPVMSGYTDLDINGHVNNIKYANYALNAVNLAPDQEIEEFQIDYHKEVLNHTALDVFIQQGEKQILVKGKNSAGDSMFSCRIELKNVERQKI